jgi:hypothetical protein
MTDFTRRLLLASTAAATLAACVPAGPPLRPAPPYPGPRPPVIARPREPRVVLLGLVPRPGSGSDLDFDVTIGVENRDVVDLFVERIRFDLDVDGRYFGRSSIDRSFVLRAGGRETKGLRIRASGLGRAAGRTVRYQIRGTVEIQAPSRARLAFTENGRIVGGGGGWRGDW